MPEMHPGMLFYKSSGVYRNVIRCRSTKNDFSSNSISEKFFFPIHAFWMGGEISDHHPFFPTRFSEKTIGKLRMEVFGEAGFTRFYYKDTENSPMIFWKIKKQLPAQPFFDRIPMVHIQFDTKNTAGGNIFDIRTG